jgi:hypothetical protein
MVDEVFIEEFLEDVEISSRRGPAQGVMGAWLRGLRVSRTDFETSLERCRRGATLWRGELPSPIRGRRAAFDDVHRL